MDCLPSGVVLLVFLSLSLQSCGAPRKVEGVPMSLVSVESAAPNVLALVFHAGDEIPPPSDKAGSYQVNGEPPRAVGRATQVVYEDKCTDWNRQRYPALLQHRIYLQLPGELEERKSYHIRHALGETVVEFDSNKMICESLKVNQVGYHLTANRRFAYHCPWTGSLSATALSAPRLFEVCDKNSSVVLQGNFVAGAKDENIGVAFLRADLSALIKPGDYYLRVPGMGRSPAFGMGEKFDHHIFYTHMKGFYHQRCGVPLSKPYTDWTRPACHTEVEITDAEPGDMIKVRGSKKLKRSGGHHDAGDFDVRFNHTLNAGWLLSAFEMRPDAFTDGQLDIPEGKNGIPDLLDEALFSIRAWETLQEPDGGIRAGFEADRHPTYGEVNAATDKLVYRTYRRQGHSTLAGCALFAWAARLVRSYDPERASELETRALKAWSFYTNHRGPGFAFDWPRASLVYAACQLYLTTGEEQYHALFKNEMGYYLGLTEEKQVWPVVWHGLYYNLEMISKGMLFTHYFSSYLYAPEGRRDSKIWEAARKGVLKRAENMAREVERAGFYYAVMQDWGASTAVGRRGELLVHGYRLTGEQRYLDAASLLSDWALGCNPSGWCFTTGLGSRPPYNPLHLDSYDHTQNGRGPAPGIVIYGWARFGGAPYSKAITKHMFPPPDERPNAYILTDGWSVIKQNEFTVAETMAPNLFLHAFFTPDNPIKGKVFPFGQAAIPGGYPGGEN